MKKAKRTADHRQPHENKGDMNLDDYERGFNDGYCLGFDARGNFDVPGPGDDVLTIGGEQRPRQ